MIRSPLREFGHILPIGIEAVTAFAKRHLAGDHPDMPEIATGMRTGKPTSADMWRCPGRGSQR